MNEAERKLLNQLTSYSFLASDVERLERELKMIGYKMTPSYSSEPSGGGFGNSRKVEDMAIRTANLKRLLEVKRSKLNKINDAVASLNGLERKLIEYLMSGNTLSAYARQNNIYKSHVYKIRDAALGKMIARIDG